MSKLKLFVFLMIALFGTASAYATSVTTYDIRSQYTTDGWLQHVAVYEDAVICTNLAGPRKNLQIIIFLNGAMDMCHTCKIHNNRFTHKYSWCEVNTYLNHQTTSW